MAKSSQGITVQFAGDDLGEAVSVSVDGVQSDTVEITPRSQSTRGKLYRPSDFDYGTLSVTFRDAGNIDISRVGEVGQIIVDQGSYLFMFDAMLQSLAWSASVGELQQLTAVFKLGVPSV